MFLNLFGQYDGYRGVAVVLHERRLGNYWCAVATFARTSAARALRNWGRPAFRCYFPFLAFARNGAVGSSATAIILLLAGLLIVATAERAMIPAVSRRSKVGWRVA